MRLLRTDTLELVEFQGRVPPYVILSHTWGPEEVSFQDLSLLPKSALKKKAGYGKIEGCCTRAVQDGYEYCWVDTCCIDKTSSAELSEAINSMYRWYQEAHICYAYMADVTLDLPQPCDTASMTTWSSTSGRSTPNPKTINSSQHLKIPIRSIPSLLRDYDHLPRTFENSRWFTRGWTLQELIAPPLVEFYSHDWQEIGTKYSLRHVISKVTGIDLRVLEGADPSTCHVAERMSWAANRQTTRVEDAAYCLLGIFKVHMPLIYGEGQRAFYRLQKEIMKTTEDYTMLAWGLSKFLSNKHHWKGLANSIHDEPRRPLADSPNDFEEHNRSSTSGWKYSRLYPDPSHVVAAQSNYSMDDTPPLITSRGLRVTLLLRPSKTRPGDVHAYINCKTCRPGHKPTSDKPLSPVCLVIRRQSSSSPLQPGSSIPSSVYTGSSDPNAAFVFLDSIKELSQFTRQTIYLSTATLDDEATSNSRIHSLSRNLYILDRPPPLRAGESLGSLSSKANWKITSCFSHAVGTGPGHAHYEVPRKFTSATLFQPFDLPPCSVRLFAFELPPGNNHHHGGENTFGIVIGNGWCDVVPLADEGFKLKWGNLVSNGVWNERNAMRYIEMAAGSGGRLNGEEEEGGRDRVVKRIGFEGLEVGVKLKKVRMEDVNCESAIKILWSVNWEG
ncbi:heterokaryon incompatibility protein-domain-containing protein [Podospora fimiseda]|uniref:Heterokaryon incompatibility protein-domain-containing protein n=1 Tax=Podospora fimiseda TaxID=252190 RepID=A0AAN7BGX9_9PEZI|nr:heterokaryon incompatibility protein-domain-containing protein [Podospora fimiseda]